MIIKLEWMKISRFPKEKTKTNRDKKRDEYLWKNVAIETGLWKWKSQLELESRNTWQIKNKRQLQKYKLKNEKEEISADK